MATVCEELRDEGWLYSEQQQKLYRLRPDIARVYPRWVAIKTYSFVPPRPPEQPMTRRWLLRHNAIEAWETMRRRAGDDARVQPGRSWIG